jgi:hypothetical protein
MATAPEPVESKPSAPVRIARKAAQPVSTAKKRRIVLLAAATGLAATAPFPANMAGAALLAYFAGSDK